MAYDRIPDSILVDINGVAEQIRILMGRAYAAGHADGLGEATERIMNAVRGVASPKPLYEQKENDERSIKENETHPNSAEGRRFPYGAVANAFRSALRQVAFIGAKRDVLISKVSEILGEDVSDMNHVDTIKRLKRTKELIVANGIYKAGPALKRPDTPDTPEVATVNPFATPKTENPFLDL
ncbi:hypothetical protein [Sphingopyxis sp. MSC1_008]|jgi:hypothetical protein|uniref:hypothetical protein n=1 Tax=Sphingopyxis sp. MSC1_008 TaxID=2909265 RepID=UPI0020C04F56|nr:hypothetical protein [Sphingopyxis sp. MSC1_008]